MRVTFAVGLLACCSLSGGCGDLLVSTVRNVRYEVALGAENVQECVRDRLVADASWKQLQAAHPEHAYSADFARGFKDGFWDYLEEGGSGNPPPLPPKVYWEVRYQTPVGHAAIADWYAGFREGAAAAHESGGRHLVVVPSSVAAPVAGPAPVATAPAPTPAAEAPELPSPRKVMPEVLPLPEDKPAQLLPEAKPMPPAPPPRLEEPTAPPDLTPAASRVPALIPASEPSSEPAEAAFVPDEWLNAVISWPGFMG